MPDRKGNNIKATFNDQKLTMFQHNWDYAVPNFTKENDRSGTPQQHHYTGRRSSYVRHEDGAYARVDQYTYHDSDTEFGNVYSRTVLSAEEALKEIKATAEAVKNNSEARVGLMVDGEEKVGLYDNIWIGDDNKSERQSKRNVVVDRISIYADNTLAAAKTQTQSHAQPQTHTVPDNQVITGNNVSASQGNKTTIELTFGGWVSEGTKVGKDNFPDNAGKLTSYAEHSTESLKPVEVNGKTYQTFDHKTEYLLNGNGQYAKFETDYYKDGDKTYKIDSKPTYLSEKDALKEIKQRILESNGAKATVTEWDKYGQSHNSDGVDNVKKKVDDYAAIDHTVKAGVIESTGVKNAHQKVNDDAQEKGTSQPKEHVKEAGDNAEPTDHKKVKHEIKGEGMGANIPKAHVLEAAGMAFADLKLDSPFQSSGGASPRGPRSLS